MSALPHGAYQPQKVGSFLGNLVEHTDDALLSDEQVYQLKGGDMNFLFKLSLGLGVVAGYLIFTKRINEVKRFEIRGSTFLMSNLIFLTTASLYQKIYNESTGVNRRLNLHKSALMYRFISNYSFMSTNRKKPIVH